MKDYIRNGLAVIGGGFLIMKAGCYFLDRYKDDILNYVADSLVDYISDEEADEKKPIGEKMKKKVLLAYLKKGANK